MSDTPAPAAAAEEGSAKKKKPLLLIIIAVVVLALGGGGAFFFLKRGNAAETEEVAEKEKKPEKGKKKAKKEEEEEEEEEEEPVASAHTGTEPSKEGKPAKSKFSIKKLDLPDDKDVKKVFELQPFIVNLADREDTRYLRMSVSIGVGETKEEKPDPILMTRIRNAMLAVLTTKTADEILTQEGKAILRKELLKAARAAIEEPHIEAIYITDFIVQM
ncbi:MAG TPA: flagellar basal body-associated FliL family protein [Blastocatellia bacterium]|nr:flagellar basal body-associated FliL family protein [Blastocatellia bacterium]